LRRPWLIVFAGLSAVALLMIGVLSSLSQLSGGPLPYTAVPYQNHAYTYRWGGPAMMGGRGSWMWQMMGQCPCMMWMWGAPAQAPPQGRQDSEAAPDVDLTIYAGEAGGRFGFGLTKDSISSPGPPIRVKSGSTVKITLINVGTLYHAIMVVSDAKDDPGAGPAFEGAYSSLVYPGSSATIYFKADKPGTYYYVCNILGHVSMGMWGMFLVED